MAYIKLLAEQDRVSVLAVAQSFYDNRFRRTTHACATKRGDGMRGKRHRLYRQAMSPWDVASRGCTREVKELALKGPVQRDASR